MGLPEIGIGSGSDIGGILQVPGSSEEETRQDQILAEAPDLAEASAQAAEWAERLAFLNEESETACFSDAIRENTDAVHYLNTQI